MFNTLRVLITLGFWLFLGYVLFYERLEAFYLAWRTSRTGVQSTLKVEPKVVKKVETVVSAPLPVKQEKPVAIKVEKPVVVKPIEVKPVVVKPVEIKPVVKPTPVVIQDEDAEDETAMEQVSFFTNDLVENSTFYKSLKGKVKSEFDDLFVLDTPNHKVKTLQYKVGGNNGSFFTDIFKSIYAYRRVISVELLNVLLNELISLAKEPSSKTLLYEAYIRVAYARRKQPAYLQEAKRVCLLDIDLHKNVLKTKNAYVYSFVRLAIIYENEFRYKEALAIIDEAIERKLDDKTVSQFAARRLRIVQKYNK
jgi:hypothetical protein